MSGTGDSYAKYLASLEPCPECGRVDEMDNIEGQLLCAACFLDQNDDEEWAEYGDGGDGNERDSA